MTAHEVTSYAACSAALRVNDLRQSLYDAASILMEKSLVNLHGAEHRARRNEESKIFRKDFFFHYEQQELPRTLGETIAPFYEAGKADLVDLGYRIMMNLTVDFAGIDRVERSAEETGDLLRLLKVFSLAPSLGQRQQTGEAEAIEAEIREAMQDFDDRYFTPSMARRTTLIADMRAGRISEADLPRDVLTTLLAGEDKLGIDRHALLQETIFLTLAGAHTSIHSLTHALHEIFTWRAAHPDQASRLTDDPFFVQRCVYESLRLHPSSPVARRRSGCPMHIAGTGDIEANDEIVVNLWAANRDSAMFGDDSKLFDPDRPVPTGQFGYGLSMGMGMHACLGRNLAVGVPAKADTDPTKHHYGTVPLIVTALLVRGIAPDPDEAARKDEAITRISWAYYPVVFEKAA